MAITASRPKVVYLIGAGATEAENHLAHKLSGSGIDTAGKLKKGLTAGAVSERVVKDLLDKMPDMLKRYGITKESLSKNSSAHAGVEVEFDVELFLSLLATIKNGTAERDAQTIRDFFRNDIVNNLRIGAKPIEPKLLASLMEWHRYIANEDVLGYLTLNYDSMLERASNLTKHKFNYGFDIKNLQAQGSSFDRSNIILKLHGSFDWYLDMKTKKVIASSAHRPSTMQWLPPSLNKDYLNYPYNIVHGKAYELLLQCDILRVIGCTLSQNDLGLISLLFKTQHRKPKPLKIEVVRSEKGFKKLVERLGSILTLESFYDDPKWTDSAKKPTNNPFLDWLSYLIDAAPGIDISKTKFLKKIPIWASK